MARVLILGATGMLGNAMLRYFGQASSHVVLGTARSRRSAALLPQYLQSIVAPDVDATDLDGVLTVVADFQPDVIINCIGLVKQLSASGDPLAAISVNALLPHRLARVATAARARFIHISTDCVFDGQRGSYVETDVANAVDLYGRSKFLGEVVAGDTVTLRTSIIGHELDSAHGLIEWFRMQTGEVKGFTQAVFSGVPTVELARIVAEYVLPNPELRGLYHISSAPIAKFDLLTIVANEYGLSSRLVPDSALVVDRSLNSDRFRAATGYSAPPWPKLIENMLRFG